MMAVRFEPAIATGLPTESSLDGFVQTIRLVDGKVILGTARWHCPPGKEGVVQILEMTIDANHRRKGLGTMLLRELVQQAMSLHKTKKVRFRRVWICVEQKSQVIARAFLTKHGYHHTGTVNELLDHQDALVYMKSMD